MLPIPTYSNCPLAVLWLWLAGRCARVIATRSDTPMFWWPWHLGVLASEGSDVVFHFKRTRVIKRQPLAPFWFEGRMRAIDRSMLLRSKSFLWERPAWRVVPWLLLLVAVGLPLWMAAGAGYWPLWLLREARSAIKKRKARPRSHRADPARSVPARRGDRYNHPP